MWIWIWRLGARTLARWRYARARRRAFRALDTERQEGKATWWGNW